MKDVEALVPKDHLLRRVERVMDYDWSTPKDCRNCRWKGFFDRKSGRRKPPAFVCLY